MNLEEMEKIASKRTQGEWEIQATKAQNYLDAYLDAPDDEDFYINSNPYIVSIACGGLPNSKQNAEFIAMAANNIDKLIAVAQAARSFRKITSADDVWAAEQYNSLIQALEELEKE